MPDPYQLVAVFADARPLLAHLARNRLLAAGIKSFIDNEDSWQGMGDLPGSMIAPPRVVVAAADESRAREIIARFTAEAT